MKTSRSCRWLLLLFFFLAGCGSSKPPTYQDTHGLQFTPPTAWALRAREGSTPAQSSRKQDWPMPPLEAKSKERLLARYDRVSAGHHAWLRVSLAEVPSSSPLQACVVSRSPIGDWKRQGEAENLEVGGLPATRVAFLGRWNNQDYRCETVAVRREDNIYFFTASFPATDAVAGEQVRQSLATVAWEQSP